MLIFLQTWAVGWAQGRGGRLQAQHSVIITVYITEVKNPSKISVLKIFVWKIEGFKGHGWQDASSTTTSPAPGGPASAPNGPAQFPCPGISQKEGQLQILGRSDGSVPGNLPRGSHAKQEVI